MYKTGKPYAPVNTLVWSTYWRKHYLVVSHNRNGSVTVRWEDDQLVTHRTPFMSGRDRIVTVAEHATKLSIIAHIAAASKVTA